MNRPFSHIIVFMASVLCIVSCKPGVPKEVIQPDDMEDILYDYYVSQGIASMPGPQSGSEDYKRDMYFNSVLNKYGVTRAEFDSSLVYYYTRADRFVEIYKSVQERMSEEALNLGATEGEVERFTAMQSLSGDTASIWEGMKSARLMPQAPYNKMQFVQKADTSFRKGESCMLSFKSDFLYQGGNKDALLYLAVKYTNDSIVSQTTHFSVSGINQLRINSVDLMPKEIMGYFYLGQGYEKSSDLRLLSISDIQLIRFHKKKEEGAEDKTLETPIEPDSIRQKKDSIRRAQQHKFGVKPTEMKELEMRRN
ncbi:MAG: DUF4296 domain-containing protein [Prevotella sp.]|nr:DUF4296 domain-containing protein [Prevotella sp.]